MVTSRTMIDRIGISYLNVFGYVLNILRMVYSNDVHAEVPLILQFVIIIIAIMMYFIVIVTKLGVNNYNLVHAKIFICVTHHFVAVNGFGSIAIGTMVFFLFCGMIRCAI